MVDLQLKRGILNDANLLRKYVSLAVLNIHEKFNKYIAKKVPLLKRSQKEGSIYFSGEIL